ncbi:gliding motility-associated peptidyl-prolyl isomerase GldI [Thalassobellus suaedae]|uniref:Peptidyl-prolyl cis-trans isomerase n=1 Tax=Thalassobellus suaedae TaxID=3074124 RepID=A0ABY9XUC0_9FLAO|nr:gliding motility-associated peptidyl-prolyl isomerase GldI [Flavobacteriaceae bacterium HL-DH14]WNH11391.1 gliding motility-associated peptidyl-prolyl isomerase GldI [Flavobacteriaceae bacterium HL-DH10]
MNKFLILTLTLLIAACKSPEARKPISSKSGSFINASIERNKKLNAQEQTAIEKIMAEQNNSYIASKSGFWYFYNNKVENDSLKTPDFGDLINYNYNVKRLNGDIIYSKEEIKTQNYIMDKQELFTGLREGLKLLKTGETATFLFPSQKAYGYYGDENKISHNTPIICEVTVNSITTQN